MNEQNTTTNPPQLGHQEQPVAPRKHWEDDKLDSENVAKTLTQLVSGQKGPLVLAVNGGWGTGKTFMLKRWQKDLANGGYEALYYSAWEDDFSREPLVCIAGQLVRHFDFGDKPTDNGKVELKTQLSAVVKQIAENSVKKLSGGIIDIRELKETVDKTNACKLKKMYHDMYKKLMKKHDTFRSTMETFANSLTENNCKPLIFIIDELDRCRPTYAIALLERIKHMLNIHGIVFVLGVNKVQLGKSICSIYGEIDSNEYLQRFIDYDLQMPVLSAEQYARALCVNSPDRPGPLFAWLCGNFRLSLRETEHCWRAVQPIRQILGKRSDENHLEYVSVLAILRLKNPELYTRFKESNSAGTEVLEYFHEQLEYAYSQLNQNELELRKIERYLYILDRQLMNEISKVVHPNYVGVNSFTPKGLLKKKYEIWVSEEVSCAKTYHSKKHPHENMKREICKLLDLFPTPPGK